MKSGTTNPELRKLIIQLRKSKKGILADVADRLERPARKNKGVNVWKINKYSKENDVIVVPGKVLSFGKLDHQVTVYALNYSIQAEDKINASGKALSLYDLKGTVPKGNVIIMQ
jgi:large subunit ribosomal protein L18e